MLDSQARQLVDMMVALADERQVESVLSRVLETVIALSNANGARVLSLDYAGRTLHAMLSRINGVDEAKAGIDPIEMYTQSGSLNFEDAHVFSLISRKIVTIPRLRQHSGFKLQALMDQDRKMGLETQSLVLLPLRTRDNKSIGVLQLINVHDDKTGEPSGLSQDIEPIIVSIASYLSVTLSNARLFQENKALIGQLNRLNEALEEENRQLRQRIETTPQSTGIVGDSEPLKKVMKLAGRAARTKVPVLVLGETGTGKEMLARAVHKASPRRDKPFVIQNCAALPENLLESELFGHTKGAFTGAVADKRGLIVEANGGTLFLDEIGDMPIGLQAKILRFLQEEEVRPIGSNKTFKVDVRIVAATHQDLTSRIKDGLFREDLYYRLSVFPVTLPALRERPSDVMLLVQHFLEQACQNFGRRVPVVSREAFDALLRWRYPGNIRELKNVVERAVLMSDDGESIKPNHLPQEMSGNANGSHAHAPLTDEMSSERTLRDMVGRFEASVIESKLREEGWNQSKCAERLGLSRRALIDKLNRYGIKRRDETSLSGENERFNPSDVANRL